MNNIIMSVDIASSKIDINGQIIYDVELMSILVYNGTTWEYVKSNDSKFEKRKRIISKLLNEK